MTNWIIVGAGYTGEKLARALVGRSADVTITRRTAAVAGDVATRVGARGVAADLTQPATLEGIVPPDAIVVCLAPPNLDPAAEIRALLAATTHAKKLVYVGSTGVYAPGGGALVDESWPLAPITTSGKKRLVAEQTLAEATIPTVILRVAGIHGPGRGTIERIRAGTYSVIGDGTGHVSRIHVDDLVEVIIAAGLSDVTGPINVADDDPAPLGVVADGIAAHLGLPPPPRIPAESSHPETAAMLTADRRIVNARMKALGVTLRYPSWRAGLA